VNPPFGKHAAWVLPAIVLVSAALGAFVAASVSGGSASKVAKVLLDVFVALGTLAAACAAAFTAHVSARQAALARPMLDAAQAQSEASTKLLEIEAQRRADETAASAIAIDIHMTVVLVEVPRLKIQISNLGGRMIHVAELLVYAEEVDDTWLSADPLLAPESAQYRAALRPGERRDVELLRDLTERRIREIRDHGDRPLIEPVLFFVVQDGHGNRYESEHYAWTDLHPEEWIAR
jgi:hypothetical protein